MYEAVSSIHVLTVSVNTSYAIAVLCLDIFIVVDDVIHLVFFIVVLSSSSIPSHTYFNLLVLNTMSPTNQ